MLHRQNEQCRLHRVKYMKSGCVNIDADLKVFNFSLGHCAPGKAIARMVLKTRC